MSFDYKTYDPGLVAQIADEYVSGIAMHVLAKKYRICNTFVMVLLHRLE